MLDPGLTRVLLVRHRYRAWVPPGGQVELGETPRAAAARELFEETGLRLVLDDWPAAVCVRSYAREWTPTVGLSYTAIADPAAALDPEPGQPAAWTPLDRPWDSWFPEDRDRIRHFAGSPRA